uniref:Uncharacterized protein n=1 Tax=Anopheles melas TaxID=34690 RepID=A0A182UGS3_9DIPT
MNQTATATAAATVVHYDELTSPPLLHFYGSGGGGGGGVGSTNLPDVATSIAAGIAQQHRLLGTTASVPATPTSMALAVWVGWWATSGRTLLGRASTRHKSELPAAL